MVDKFYLEIFFFIQTWKEAKQPNDKLGKSCAPGHTISSLLPSLPVFIHFHPNILPSRFYAVRCVNT